jgi:hypothetical protein
MNIVPINVADVLQAIEDMLRAWSALQGSTIEQCEEVNEEPRRCPWIGIYRLGVKYPPRTLGGGTGYRRNNIDLILVTEHVSFQSGKDCMIALESLNQAVIACLLTDASLGGLVDTLDDFSVVYPDFQKTDKGYFQKSLIYFTGVTNVTAS